MIKKKLARILSEISNGFLTMILTPVIPILFSLLDSEKKILLSLIYILLPLVPFFIFKKLGMISDYEFTKREERPPYFITVSILMGMAYLFVRTLGIEILTSVSLNIFLVSTALTIVTFLWKMSGHMTYSTALFCTLIYIFPSTPLPYLLFLFSPFIGWSRIELDKHTLTQVTVGTLVTLTISILIYWGFW